MTPTPVIIIITPQQSAAAMQLIETAGKTLGAQSWGVALELLEAIQTEMEAAAKADQKRIAAFEPSLEKQR